jgi:hypothetical protein
MQDIEFVLSVSHNLAYLIYYAEIAPTGSAHYPACHVWRENPNLVWYYSRI